MTIRPETIIKIVDLCGSVCVSPQNGFKICESISGTLAQGGAVVLDFAGVEVLATSFLNAAVACLHQNYPIEELAGRLTWRGMSADNDALLELVRRNALRLRESSPENRRHIADATARSVAGAC